MNDWRRKVLKVVLVLTFAPALLASHCPFPELDCLFHHSDPDVCLDLEED